MSLHRVVLYMLDEPDVKLVLTERQPASEARRIMRQLANHRTWNMERRQDLHTFGQLVLAMEREVL